MKKIFAALFILVTVASVTPLALAVSTEQPVPAPQCQCQDCHERHQQVIEDMAEKFAGLTDAQKAKVYRIDAKMSDLVCQMADIYAEYGLIDDAVADRIGEMAKERARMARKEGRLPGVIGPY